ncbi:MAG TPA: nitrilase family protein [Parasegetibacter sp.]|jgi:omega-amidase
MSPLTISLLQQDLFWEDKTANLNSFEKALQQIPSGTHLVVLPEMFNTGFSMNADALAEKMDGPSVDWMKNIALKKRIILTGSLMIREEGKYYNRLIWMLPNGQFAYYDKRHCFGYAGEDKIFTPGKKRLIASVNGWKICLMVCYDLRFPVWSRNRFSEDELTPEYDLLVYVANWPEKRIHAWNTLLQARAIENQCFVAGVNRTGIDGNGIYYNGSSMLINPAGEILYHKCDTPDIFTTTLLPEQITEWRFRYPFLKDQDHFLIEA